MLQEIQNKASIKYTYEGARTSSNATSNVVVANVRELYELEGEKYSVQPSFRAGGCVTYMVRVKNVGENSVFQVTLSDNLADGKLYVNSDAVYVIYNGDVQKVTPTSTSPLVVVLGEPLAPGETAIFIYGARVVDNLDSSVSKLINCAHICASATETGEKKISVVPNPCSILPLEEYANVTIFKSISSNEVVVGEEFTYTFTLTNSGQLDAKNVVLTDELPKYFKITKIVSVTGTTVKEFTSSMYTVDTSTNTLTLPNASVAGGITVPAISSSGGGVTVVTITGKLTQVE